MRPATKIWVTAATAAPASLLGMTASAALGDTTRVSVASDGIEGNDWSGLASISANGRYLAFNGHLFEDDITAIAQAGITRGCNPPANDRYCPDDSPEARLRRL